MRPRLKEWRNELNWNDLSWTELNWIELNWIKFNDWMLKRKSRTKASFPHLQLSLFEGSLARKLRFHIFHCQNLREVSHQSFVFTFRFWGKAPTKCVLRVSRWTKFCVLQDKTCLGRCMGKLVWRTVAEHARLYRDNARIGRALELPVQAYFSQLELSKFEGSLAPKLRFHIFHFKHFLKEV